MPPEKDRRISDAKCSAGAHASQSDQQGAGELGDVYFEFRPVGNYMRVDAIHAATGTETYVLGPLHTSQNSLKMLALRKLKLVIQRNRR